MTCLPASYPAWHPCAGGGKPPTVFPIRPVPGVLDVVTAISNPMRFRSRYALHRRFADRMAAAGVRLTTVELAYGSRPFEVTEAGNPRHVQVRSSHELWHKENLLNLGVARLPEDWRYVAWIDADVSFARHSWAQETIQRLQHHPVVQLFSTATDLDPNYDPHDSEKGVIQDGFAASYSKWRDSAGGGKVLMPCYGSSGSWSYYGANTEYWHPGFAWAMRRQTFDDLGGLIDFAALGSADHHMAWALIGEGQHSIHGAIGATYRDQVLRWQGRAEQYVARNIGYVPGLLIHEWHGKKKDRKYKSRWDILIEHGFDPDLDLKRDWQGVWQLTDRSPGLRDGFKAYFATRNEDSNEL